MLFLRRNPTPTHKHSILRPQTSSSNPLPPSSNLFTQRLTFCLRASRYRLLHPVTSTNSHDLPALVVTLCEVIRPIPFQRSESMDKDIPTFYVKTLPSTKHFRNGGSGILYTYASCTTKVIKLPFSSEASTANLEIEKRVYQRLGCYPNIIRCLRIEDYGIHLERAEHSSVREYYAEAAPRH